MKKINSDDLGMEATEEWNKSIYITFPVESCSWMIYLKSWGDK